MALTPPSRPLYRNFAKSNQPDVPQGLSSFAADVVRGRIKDVKTLLLARSGPVTREEIEKLSRELRLLEQPHLPQYADPRNLDATISQISAFGQRRKVLSDYRQCLHDILQYQHRSETLARSEAQLRELRRKTRDAGFNTEADLKARLTFWETTAQRDRESLKAIEERLKKNCPISLAELRERIARQDA